MTKEKKPYVDEKMAKDVVASLCNQQMHLNRSVYALADHFKIPVCMTCGGAGVDETPSCPQQNCPNPINNDSQ